VYVTFAAGSAYVKDCFSQYGLITDATGQYAALYRPSHLIGLELGISVASVALRREATGAPETFQGDVVAVAKRDLGPGEQLDGEGGFTVHGRLMRANDSLADGCLPIGLAQRCVMVNALRVGEIVKWRDVRTDETSEAVRVRREMEALFRVAPDYATST
jgi:predicted homoserine dehydrogenase-like protein